MAKNSVQTGAVREVWLTLEQAADAVGISPATVRRWALDGDARLPAYQVWDEGNTSPVRFRFKKSDVEAFRALPPAQEAAPPEPSAASPRRSPARSSSRVSRNA